MSQEPLIAPAAQMPYTIETDAPTVAREVPTPEQQSASDDVFTSEAGQAVTALMTLQAGVAIVQLIADNNRVVEESREVPPKRKLVTE